MDVRVWSPAASGPLRQDLLQACVHASTQGVVVQGDLTDASFYEQWADVYPLCVILSLRGPLQERVREFAATYLPRAISLVLHHGHPEKSPRTLDNDRELILTWAELLWRPVAAELRHLQSIHRVRELRSFTDDADHIALLLQPDPDPDGLAAALGLRTVLGRNKLSTPIVSFGRVTRPENLAMLRLLDIEVLTIQPEELAGYDRVLLLDTQPGHFSFPLARVDGVIDHHPEVGDYGEIPFLDIRTHYGATSTIIAEYLKAAACSVGQRLATALIYGIKTDTLHLNRSVSDGDLDAYVGLYPHVNTNLLRRMEKPELPRRFAPVLAEALREVAVEGKVLSSCLGEVEREDLIPQIADFLLQFEDVEWVLASGVFEGNVIVSVRNVGYVKNAGDAVKRVVCGWGTGGGHRSMAKAIFPLDLWLGRFGSSKPQDIQREILALFVEELA